MPMGTTPPRLPAIPDERPVVTELHNGQVFRPRNLPPVQLGNSVHLGRPGLRRRAGPATPALPGPTGLGTSAAVLATRSWASSPR